MSLDGQKGNFDRKPAALDSRPEPLSGSERNKTRFGFSEKDFVVYPAHGVGQILMIEDQAVAGASLEFFVIYFPKNKMTVRVPIRKATNIGMRRPSDFATIQRVKRLLSEPPRKARGIWSRLAQEYEGKINSGDILAVAEVVRDLCRPDGDSGQSFSERQLYASALDRLSGEVALVDGILEKQAVNEIEGLVKIGAPKRSA